MSCGMKSDWVGLVALTWIEFSICCLGVIFIILCSSMIQWKWVLVINWCKPIQCLQFTPTKEHYQNKKKYENRTQKQHSFFTPFSIDKIYIFECVVAPFYHRFQGKPVFISLAKLKVLLQWHLQHLHSHQLTQRIFRQPSKVAILKHVLLATLIMKN